MCCLALMCGVFVGLLSPGYGAPVGHGGAPSMMVYGAVPVYSGHLSKKELKKLHKKAHKGYKHKKHGHKHKKWGKKVGGCF